MSENLFKCIVSSSKITLDGQRLSKYIIRFSKCILVFFTMRHGDNAAENG